MADNTNPVGTFTWVELGTKDTNQIRGFYGEVLGWSYQEDEMPQGGSYIMGSAGDKVVCGIYGLTPEMPNAEMPPFWLSYIGTDDVDATVKRVEELGGKVMGKACDVMDAGRMAACFDPSGAMFALWQPKKHKGADQGEFAPGTRCWSELVSTDVEKSRAFFSDLFGWTCEEMNMGETTYNMFKRGDEQVAGMMAKEEKFGPMPSTWVNYFIVPDHDAAAGKAEAMGGKALMPAIEMPDIGRFSWLMDPAGAMFGILQPPANP